MRSPRLIYLAVVAVLAVAGFALTQYLADRSAPGLGETIVVPAGSGGPAQPSSKPANPSTGPGAEQVSPAPVRTAGDDDDRDDDGLDDNLDNDPDDGADDD